MSLTKYDGICFRCGKIVKAGKGDFQSVGSFAKRDRVQFIGKGKWQVRCFACKGQGNKIANK